MLQIFSLLTSITIPRWLKKFFAILLGGHTTIGPFLISIGGRGIALEIFLFFVNFFRLARFMVEIKLTIFLLDLNLSLFRIFKPTFGVENVDSEVNFKGLIT